MFVFPLSVFVLGGLASPVVADTFLEREWAPASSSEAGPELQQSLLAELEDELGTEHRQATEDRLAQIKEVVRPTFEAMPKNENGRLEHTAVRYTLHRFFVQRHGWFVRGLEPDGGAWNTTSPIESLEGNVPQAVKGLFEKRLAGRGFGLHELAVFAAILENLVHSEAKVRLTIAFTINNLPVDGIVHGDVINKVLDTYMAFYILIQQGQSVTTMTSAQLQTLVNSMEEMYPNWNEARQFVRQVTLDVAGSRTDFDFSLATDVVSRISDRFGSWMFHRECLDLKHKLIAIEDRGSGCVRLGKFYGTGDWHFEESPEYLRELGVLDESDPKSPLVVVPNFVNAPSNCMATSNYYSLCCMNECDDLFGHLERKLQAPDATPAEIAALVAALPSDTVPANRKLPSKLLQHLDEIAQAHGGRVPLHGRLFKQWMHNAYPHECEFPHVSGTTKPRTPGAFTAETGLEVLASADAKRQFFASSPRPRESEEGGCTPWDHVEELFVPSIMMPAEERMEQEQGILWAEAKGVAMLSALATMVVVIVRAWRLMLSTRFACSPQKFVVV